MLVEMGARTVPPPQTRGSDPGAAHPAPPDEPPEGGGGGGRWAWLMTASGQIEAELVRGYLEESGVPVALDRRDPSPSAWLFPSGNVNAPVQVLVPATLLETARLELLEAGLAAGEPPEPRRPAEARVPRTASSVATVAVAVIIGGMLLLLFYGRATCLAGVLC